MQIIFFNEVRISGTQHNTYLRLMDFYKMFDKISSQKKNDNFDIEDLWGKRMN